MNTPKSSFLLLSLLFLCSCATDRYKITVSEQDIIGNWGSKKWWTHTDLNSPWMARPKMHNEAYKFSLFEDKTFHVTSFRNDHQKNETIGTWLLADHRLTLFIPKDLEDPANQVVWISGDILNYTQSSFELLEDATLPSSNAFFDSPIYNPSDPNLTSENPTLRAQTRRKTIIFRRVPADFAFVE